MKIEFLGKPNSRLVAATAYSTHYNSLLMLPVAPLEITV